MNILLFIMAGTPIKKFCDPSLIYLFIVKTMRKALLFYPEVMGEKQQHQEIGASQKEHDILIISIISEGHKNLIKLWSIRHWQEMIRPSQLISINMIYLQLSKWKMKNLSHLRWSDQAVFYQKFQDNLVKPSKERIELRWVSIWMRLWEILNNRKRLAQ